MTYVLTLLMLLWTPGLQEKPPPEPDIRLMGGASRCAGILEVNFHNKWQPVDDLSFGWNLRTAAVVCEKLDCGSAISTKMKYSYARYVWKINSSSVQSAEALTDHILMSPQYSSSSLEIACSESVRLVNETTLCSGTVEVRAEQSWSLACEGDFGLKDAEVVCRELGCGAPLKLQEGHYEHINTLEWLQKFQCRGNESTLLDCGRETYEKPTDNCTPVKLTCSEPDNIRLVRGGSRCAGRVEMKLQGDWKPVEGLKGDLTLATLACKQLKCGSAISSKIKPSTATQYVWGISSAVQSGSALREHISTRPWHSSLSLEIACSDLLFQPEIYIAPSTNWINSYFTIGCSIKPQYPGGFFQLIVATSTRTRSYAQKSVNHTSHFEISAAENGQQANIYCIYHIYVFSHKFSSKSQPLSFSISAYPAAFIIRLGLLLILASVFTAIYFHKKVPREQVSASPDDIELEYYNPGASRADGGPNDATWGQENDHT